MGLDGVEFIFAVEDAFAIAIPAADASELSTPRRVVDYLVERLHPGDTTLCHPQRAFYRLRAAVTHLYGLDRRAVHPETHWDAILPKSYRDRAWTQLQKTVGVVDWPSHRMFGPRHAARTVGATATYIATVAPATFKPTDEGWSRTEIERVVRGLIAEELGILTFDWDDRFVQDLNID